MLILALAPGLRARQADPRPADADPHSRAGLPRATPGPPDGPHATWHAIDAACNKTELIRLLAYCKQIYHAVIWHHGMG